MEMAHPVSKKSYFSPQYRARGIYRRTGRESWITTSWRRTSQEAKDDIRYFGNSDRYSKTWIVKRTRRQ